MRPKYSQSYLVVIITFPIYFSVNLKDMKVTASVFIPNVNVVGHYDVKGRILILPIVGSGPANFTFGKPKPEF